MSEPREPGGAAPEVASTPIDDSDDPAYRLGRWIVRNRLLAGLAAVICLGLVVGGVVSLLPRSGDELRGVYWVDSEVYPTFALEFQRGNRYVFRTESENDSDGISDAGDYEISADSITFLSEYPGKADRRTLKWEIAGDILTFTEAGANSEGVLYRMSYAEYWDVVQK